MSVTRTFTEWLLDQLDWIIPVVVTLGIVLTLIGGMIGGAMVLDRSSCYSQADAMSVNWSWGILQGCMIVVDGKNIPLSAYKVVKIAN